MSSKSIKYEAEKYYPADLLKSERESYNDMCKKELSDMYIHNFLWNMPIIQSTNPPGILGFKKLFKGLPAVIVGAGCSLDKNGHLLKQYRDNLIIIACDAALPVLVNKYGVYPHFVVMADPTEKQKDNFKDIDTTKFYTIAPAVVHPSVLRAVDPRHLAIYNIKEGSNAILESAPYHIGRRGGLPAGILTTGSCFGFAGIMYCDPIVFLGQDLSWESPEKVYADGIAQKKIDYQKGIKFRSNCSLFPDIYGKLVLTHQTFVMFWGWLRENSKFVSSRLINATEGGILKFDGMRIMRFADVIAKYASKQLVGVDEKISKAYNDRYSDGQIEEILLPPIKKRKGVK